VSGLGILKSGLAMQHFRLSQVLKCNIYILWINLIKFINYKFPGISFLKIIKLTGTLLPKILEFSGIHLLEISKFNKIYIHLVYQNLIF